MKTKILLIFILNMVCSFGQTGGTTSFSLLDLTYNARSAGLGGDFITVSDYDINMGVSNPSLLNKEMGNTISFNSSLLAGGINYGMLSYGVDTKKLGTIATYIKYVNYGKFQRTAVNGINEGTFNPFEMIAGGAIGYSLSPRMTIGVDLNFIYSQLESYNSFGGSVDFAGTYNDKDKGFLVTILAKNIGYQFKSYVKDSRAPLPVELQLAASYKVKHAPFRLSILGHHLNKWDITYQDPNLQPTIDPLSGDTIPVKRPGFMEKLAHHFTYQLEVLITKNIDFRIGFDYHRRKELALESRPGISGFSVGAGVHFSKFSLDYGFIIYSRAGYNNMLTLSTNLSKWKK